MFRLDRAPYEVLSIETLQKQTTQALDRMVAHQRAAEALMELSGLCLCSGLFKKQADHHFKMACYWRKRAGDFWTIWQARLRQREEFLAECERIAADA